MQWCGRRGNPGRASKPIWDTIRRPTTRSVPPSRVPCDRLREEVQPRNGSRYSRMRKRPSDGWHRTSLALDNNTPCRHGYRHSAKGEARHHHRSPMVPGSQGHRRQREGRQVGKDCGGGARQPGGGLAELRLRLGSACGAPPTIPRQPRVDDLRAGMDGGAPVGRRPLLQDEI